MNHVQLYSITDIAEMEETSHSNISQKIKRGTLRDYVPFWSTRGRIRNKEGIAVEYAKKEDIIRYIASSK